MMTPGTRVARTLNGMHGRGRRKHWGRPAPGRLVPMCGVRSTATNATMFRDAVTCPRCKELLAEAASR